MTGLLSLPPELSHKIIQICPQQERCRLRATCKFLSELADPIVFRRLSLYFDGEFTEHQIIALVTRSSKACEFTKDMDISGIDDYKLRASEHSWQYFGHCDDLRVHIPTAISTLRHLTSFRWCISDDAPDWQINSLMQAVARLPRLTELEVTCGERNARIPLGLFSNLSKLSVSWGCQDTHHPFFISQMATVIANSTHLRFLHVEYSASMAEVSTTLSDLFAKVSMKNPLCLEHLSINYMDATITQATLPHMTHLTSFNFLSDDSDVATRVWTSFLDNNIRLLDMVVPDIVTDEMMLYLSSFSGLKSLVLTDVGDMESMLFEDVLPKHVNSLQTLHLSGWDFDPSKAKSIMSCLKLRDLKVNIDAKDDTTLQLLLDSLPELEILRLWIHDPPQGWGPKFKQNLGPQCVEELEISYIGNWTIYQRRYLLEKDGGQSLGYREIPWH